MRRFGLLSCCLCLLAGCQGWNSSLTDKLPWSSREPKVAESPYPAPTRIVAIWSDAVYTEPGRPAVRGVGGRLYFQDDKNDPVPVEGQLVVYGYDDSTTTPAQTPTRKFVFTAEQFQERWSPTDLGASYSVWLPWDDAGGVKKSISLLPVFTASSGKVVMGTQAISVLPGKAAPEAELTRKGHFTSPSQEAVKVQNATFEQPAGITAASQVSRASGELPAESGGAQMRTTTIRLPPATTQRMILEQATARLQTGSSPASAAAAISAGGLQPAAGAAQTAATAPALPEPLPPARFERPRYQAPGGASSLPGRDHAPSLPGPAGPLPGPPSLR